MKNRSPALAAAVLVTLLGCKPRSEAVSAVRADARAGESRFLPATARPNPLDAAELAALANQLEAFLREVPQQSGLSLAASAPEASNSVAALAIISWSIGDVKVTSDTLHQLGDPSDDQQRYDTLVHRFDAELNKRAKLLNYEFLADSQNRDAANVQHRQELLTGYGAGVGELKIARADAIAQAAREVSALKDSGKGFAGLACEVIGGTPTANLTPEQPFDTASLRAIADVMESLADTKRAVARGQGICFDVAPGYPFFLLDYPSRCASAFQPDDPRVTASTTGATTEGYITAFALPQSDPVETVCFSRVPADTKPVNADVEDLSATAKEPTKPTPILYGSMRNVQSSIFSAVADCNALAQGKPELCKSVECRAVAKGKIADCYSKDCRALILKRAAACGSSDCRGMVRGVAEDCASNYCRAVIAGKPGLCQIEATTEGDSHD